MAPESPDLAAAEAELDATTGWSCVVESWPGPGGQIVVSRVAGDIDLLSYAQLQAALDSALFGTVDQPTSHLVVDCAGLTFCCVRGLALLADMGLTASANSIGYSLSGCTDLFERHWRMLHADAAPVRRYPTAAAAVIAILAD